MYFHHIHPQVPFKSISNSVSTQLYIFFFKTHAPKSHTPKENGYSFSQKLWNPSNSSAPYFLSLPPTSLSYAGILSDLSLLEFCACCHKHWIHICNFPPVSGKCFLCRHLPHLPPLALRIVLSLLLQWILEIRDVIQAFHLCLGIPQSLIFCLLTSCVFPYFSSKNYAICHLGSF